MNYDTNSACNDQALGIIKNSDEARSDAVNAGRIEPANCNVQPADRTSISQGRLLRPNIRHIYSKIAGVSFANDDGVSRQQIIEQACRQYACLRIVPECDNPRDPNALAVLTASGARIGYIRKGLRQELLGYILGGYVVLCLCTAVTGGQGKMLGVNIAIVIADHDVSADEFSDYMQQTLLPEIKTNRQNRLKRQMFTNNTMDPNGHDSYCSVRRETESVGVRKDANR